MAVRNWHPGQLCVLWVGGLGVEGAIWWLLANIPSTHNVFDGRGMFLYTDTNILGDIISLVMTLIAVSTPIALLVLTWKWFGSRPGSRGG